MQSIVRSVWRPTLPQSLRARIVAGLIVVGLLPILVAWGLIWTQSGGSREEVDKNLLLLSDYAAEGVEQALKEAATLTQMVAQDQLLAVEGVGRTDLEARLVYLNELIPQFEHLTLVDSEGRVLASSTYDYRGVGRSQEVFRRAFEGQVAISPAHLTLRSSEPAVTFAAPVVGPGDSVPAIVIGELSISNMSDVALALGVGEEGQTSVLNSLGQVLAHPDTEHLMTRPRIGEGLAATAATTIKLTGPDGDQLHAVTPVRVDGMMENWWVVLEVPSSQAYASINRTNWIIIFVGIGVLVIVAAVSLVLGESISRPVRKVTIAARRMAGGDLGARAETSQGGEVGDLSQSFNTMAESLSVKISELDVVNQGLREEIAERKRAEEALRESEEQHRQVLDNYPDGVDLQIDGRITYANPMICQLTGYSLSDVLGEAPEKFVVPEERGLVRDRVRKLLAGASGRPVEYHLLKKDGDIVPVELTSQVIQYSGKPALLNVLRDITQRKQTEEALQESEELYRTLVDNSVLGLGIYTPGESIIFGNQRLSQIVGYTKEEYESPEFNIMDLFLAEDQKLIADNIRKRLAGEDIPPYEVRLITKDQTVKWVEIHNVFVRYRGRGAMQVQLLDVTERKRAEQRVQEAARLASIGELAAGVAHEINNPLTSVLGFSQLLMAEDLPPEVRADLQKIHSGARRATKIVQSLLSFATKREYREQYLDVTQVLERALEIKSYDLSTSNIGLTSELSPDLPRTRADEHQLIQVIVNLLTNAEQATRASNGRGQVLVRATSSDTKINISISDNGPGIPPEHLSRIFEPFFTTKEVGEGTGLGLSICYGIIREHDGNLWAESIPGEGATFHIELPIVSPDGRGEAEPIDQRPQQIAGTTKHVLVVDDEPDIRDLLIRSLEWERYTVDLADEGEEAWRKLQTQSYDCILLDLKMAGMSGQELYRRIEGSDTGLGRKVIFMTGDTVSPDTQDFVTATGNPVMRKPLDLVQLNRQVREVLETTRDA